MSKSERKQNKAWMKKFVARHRLVVEPLAISDASLIEEETPERRPAVAAVIAPAESAAGDDLGSHAPPPFLGVVGSGETAGEEDVPIPISAVMEDVMAPLASAALVVGIGQSGEDQLRERSGSPDAFKCAIEASALIPSTISPARSSQDGAGKIGEVPSPVAGPEDDETPRASSPLRKEQTDVSPVGLISRSSSPAEDKSPSRKRRRESESCSPLLLLPPPPIETDPSPAPPSSGSYIPELGDLQHIASMLGEHSLSSTARAFMGRQSSCMRMKAASKALSEVCFYVADFATHASRNVSLELSSALEKIDQFEDIEKQHLASIDLLGHQCDELNVALAECEDRVARKEADLRKVEQRLLESERYCNRLSRSCSHSEDEVRFLRDIWRRHQELENPEPKKGRSTEESLRIETRHHQRASSSARADHRSEERMRARGKQLIDEAIRAAFSAGRSSNPNAGRSAQDEVLKNMSANFQSRFDDL